MVTHGYAWGSLKMQRRGGTKRRRDSREVGTTRGPGGWWSAWCSMHARGEIRTGAQTYTDFTSEKAGGASLTGQK